MPSMKDELPSAEVSALLFRCSERLDKYVQRAKHTDIQLWQAIIEQLDTIASVVAETDELCDDCGMSRSTGKDMMCDDCRKRSVDMQ